jgi:hypothetical protein
MLLIKSFEEGLVSESSKVREIPEGLQILAVRMTDRLQVVFVRTVTG